MNLSPIYIVSLFNDLNKVSTRRSGSFFSYSFDEAKELLFKDASGMFEHGWVKFALIEETPPNSPYGLGTKELAWYKVEVVGQIENDLTYEITEISKPKEVEGICFFGLG